MNIESFRNFCLSRKGAKEDFPFDDNTMVFKVMGKMFALGDVQDFVSINLKVDPETGVELRERYPSVLEGYHMNKKHWITVLMDGSVPDRYICQWINNSYDLVVAGLTKSQKSALDSR
ncbi:MAG: MmcQ/YjbR family DNA-binding protein [Cyclobacteriaceae bacterium]|nr:MmcQ/YjbR family DNA-binding protein [Cyclobacteriaceae bacterium]MDH4296470.1 MmcQ/YjbR family DNA-binding protein [Cyclobacteriaceae bacterium]MDH5249065.1 MmcQ/YjbR family DNA-binding protein [Cyclobacteriaceae bacterium]